MFCTPKEATKMVRLLDHPVPLELEIGHDWAFFFGVKTYQNINTLEGTWMYLEPFGGCWEMINLWILRCAHSFLGGKRMNYLDPQLTHKYGKCQCTIFFGRYHFF
jgi:hypothetical protein